MHRTVGRKTERMQSPPLPVNQKNIKQKSKHLFLVATQLPIRAEPARVISAKNMNNVRKNFKENTFRLGKRRLIRVLFFIKTQLTLKSLSYFLMIPWTARLCF